MDNHGTFDLFGVFMTRQTSIDAYNAIVNDGRRDTIKKRVYRIYYEHGPMTAQEMTARFFVNDTSRGSFVTRISEMVNEGTMISVGEKLNPETGLMNTLWDVTDNKPTKWDKPKKIKCAYCKGTGVIQETQARLF